MPPRPRTPLGPAHLAGPASESSTTDDMSDEPAALTSPTGATQAPDSSLSLDPGPSSDGLASR